MLTTGTLLVNRYEIQKRIGTGGMADVYMAKDNKLGRYVAIKVLKEEFSSDETFLRKFDSEAKAVAGLIHPNIINVYDVGVEGDIHFIVMELGNGITLKEYIMNKKRLSAEETVACSIQIAEAIECAHQHNIIHRDIKPQNILISSYGTIKVTDFGIAKAATSQTMTTTAIGSVHYLSPEQARGGFCDSRSDIYALGVTMYEMVTGRVPFDHENSVTIALMHLQNDVLSPQEINNDIPTSLEKIILKCLAKRPEERYQTAGELIKDLKQVFDDPEGRFVTMPVFVDDSPTQMRGTCDIERVKGKLKHQRNFPKEEVEQKDMPETVAEEEEEEESKVSGKMEKLIVLLAIVVAIIIAIGIFSFIVKTSGLFKSGKQPTSVTTTEKTTKEEIYNTSVVPSLKGLTEDAAKERLEDEDLKAKVVYETSDTVKSGCVIRQSIEEGQEVESGTTVVITISKADERVTIPNVKGYSQYTATQKLKSVPLRVSVEETYSSSVAAGKVISQRPSSGTKCSKNATVVIVVSKGNSKVRVPSLTSYTKSEAAKQLSNMGLQLGKVSQEYSNSVRKGLVIRQGTQAGSRVSKGTAISVVISLGPKPTTEATTTTEHVTTTTTEAPTTTTEAPTTTTEEVTGEDEED